MTTLVLSQVPNPDVSAPIAAHELTLIRMNDYIVDRDSMAVVALNGALTRIPYLDCSILGGRDHPFPLAMEGYACDVGGMAVEGQNSIWIRRLYVVEFHGVVAGGCEVAFVGRDAKAVHLRVWVWYCARADA